MFRQHHIADTDGGGQCFCKGIDIDDFFKDIDALQGGNRLTGEAELAVVIILDNIAGRRFGSPSKKFIASSDRHGDACRELVGRGNMDDVNIFCFQFGNPDAAVIHGNIIAVHIVAVVDFGDFVIARVFNGVFLVEAQKLNQDAV